MKTLHILLLSAASCIIAFTAAHGEEIINGQKAEKNSLQFMGSVQKNKKHQCGGFLIHQSFVLTAAHCKISLSELSVVLGTHNINPQNKKLRRYAVKSMHMHESYVKSPGNGYDIMLLKLAEKVKVNNEVKISKIPKKRRKIKPNTKCQVAGWGKTKKNEKSVNKLLVTNVSTIDIEICKKKWNKVLKLPPNVLCAGGYKTDKGACQGDSGGPLVCSGEAVGIVSFNKNNNCTYPDVPNVYTDIASYATWIKDVINKYA
ncbi:mast cell protease 1A-like [Silurus meridionalis]|uniref:Peptidase S1 domain-containing protein n=1 Tax=Silurus meridionalis TaxID=175797 RepID=A0A8T0BCC4_SILME|nr:mast cell protease 1A-like [Silurus meridionalis]KAF7702976.1 hypothetical protein HF521_021983 [Silurus meridionalis]